MTDLTGTVDVEVKDFSNRADVQFRIDDDLFQGVPNIAALQLLEFANLSDQLTDASMADQPKIFKALVDLLLTPDSALRFSERMGDRENPISIIQVQQVIEWLMERYGMRPTQPSGDSSSGSATPDAGTSLTANVPVVGLNLAPSPQTVS